MSNHMSFQWSEIETNETTMMVHDGAYMCILSTVHFSILTTWPRIEPDFWGSIYFLSADRSASLQGRQESNSWRRFGYQVSIPSMVAWPHLDGTVLWIDWIDWIGDDRGSLAAPCVQALWKSGCWICMAMDMLLSDLDATYSLLINIHRHHACDTSTSTIVSMRLLRGFQRSRQIRQNTIWQRNAKNILMVWYVWYSCRSLTKLGGLSGFQGSTLSLFHL